MKIIDVSDSFFEDSVSSASPHAIAFLAGYGADVLFSLLDKAVVAALRPIQPHTCTADISYGEGLRKRQSRTCAAIASSCHDLPLPVVYILRRAFGNTLLALSSACRKEVFRL
jgi:hypothetical protein